MLLLIPAYGRVYKSIDEAEKDWIDGKDFRILNGPYCSIRDKELIESMGHGLAIAVGNISKIIMPGS